MINFKKNKKGQGAGGFGIIIAIIIVVISAVAILWVLKSSASKVDEELQVDLCRISNEFLVSTEEKSPWYLRVHSPRVCNTIWRTDKNLRIPTEKYKEKYGDIKKAAEAEIMDSMAKCWYMWLEGSKENIFPKEGIGPIGRLWGGSGCYTCYAFMIKDEVKGITTDGLFDSMKDRTYTAEDLSSKCAPNGGFLVKDSEDACSGEVNGIDGGWKKVSLKDNKACCVREKVMDECGNRGGKCSSTGPDVGTFEHEYPKWSCPKANQKCYVKSKVSYYDYLMSGRKSTEPVVTIPLNFKKGVFTIAFHSYRDDKGAFIGLAPLDLNKNLESNRRCKSD